MVFDPMLLISQPHQSLTEPMDQSLQPTSSSSELGSNYLFDNLAKKGKWSTDTEREQLSFSTEKDVALEFDTGVTSSGHDMKASVSHARGRRGGGRGPEVGALR